MIMNINRLVLKGFTPWFLKICCWLLSWGSAVICSCQSSTERQFLTGKWKLLFMCLEADVKTWGRVLWSWFLSLLLQSFWVNVSLHKIVHLWGCDDEIQEIKELNSIPFSEAQGLSLYPTPFQIWVFFITIICGPTAVYCPHETRIFK